MLTATVATWWLLGGVSDQARQAGSSPLAPPWPLPAQVGHAIHTVGYILGPLVIAAAVGAVVLLVRESHRGHFDRRWWGTLVPVLMVGILFGVGYRSATTGISITDLTPAGRWGLIVLTLLLTLWPLVWTEHLLRSSTYVAPWVRRLLAVLLLTELWVATLVVCIGMDVGILDETYAAIGVFPSDFGSFSAIFSRLVSMSLLSIPGVTVAALLLSRRATRLRRRLLAVGLSAACLVAGPTLVIIHDVVNLHRAEAAHCSERPVDKCPVDMP